MPYVAEVYISNIIVVHVLLGIFGNFPLPLSGASTGVSPATTYKQTGYPEAISTVVVTNSPPSNFANTNNSTQQLFLYNSACVRDVMEPVAAFFVSTLNWLATIHLESFSTT